MIKVRVRSPLGYDGADNAPHRVYLRAISLIDEDLSKPLMAVVATWSELGPCKRGTVTMRRS